MRRPEVSPRVAGRQVRAVLARRRRAVVAAVAIVLVVAGIVAALWFGSQYGRAQEVRALLMEVRAATSGTRLLDDVGAAQEFVARLAEIEEEVLGLQTSLRPVAGLSRVFGWLPFIGDDLRAAPRLVDRAVLDLSAAGDMVEAGIDLRSRFLHLGDTLFADPAAVSAGGTQAGSDGLRRRLASAAAGVELARSYASEIDPEGLQASLKDAALLLDSEEERIAQIASWGLSAVDLLESLSEVAGISGVLLDRGVAPEESLDTLVRESDRDLVVLSDAAWRAHELATVVRETLPGDIASSSLATDVEPMVSALQGLALMAEGAGIGLRSLHGAMRVLEEEGVGLLGEGRGLARVLEVIAEASDSIQRSVELVQQADAAILEALEACGEGSAAAQGLDRLGRAIDRLLPALRFIDAAGDIGPGLLGIGGRRTYLLLGQSADELRATGGFVFAVWVVTLVDGEMRDIEYVDIAEVDDRSSLHLYPEPPPALGSHMNAPVWLMRDVTWDPDFPATARMAQRLFALGRDREVDGVVALNQWAMQDILEALGPLKVEFDGATVDVDNFITVLEEGTDAHGRAYADAVLRAMLDALSGQLPTTTVLALAADLQQVFDRGDFLVYSDDTVEQSSLHSLGWDGAVDQGATDYIFVVDSNVGWNKVDRKIERGLSYEVTFSTPEELTAKLTLSYRNLGDPSVTCDSQWEAEEGSGPYEELKNACYWDFVRVYLPDRVSYRGGDRIPLPPNSVSESIGLATVGDDTFALGAGHGRTVFSGLIALAPSEVKRLGFQYDLPSDVLQRDSDLLSYELLLQAQPGARGRSASVAIRPPVGWEVADLSGPNAAIIDGQPTFRFDLIEDARSRVEFARMPAEAGR